MKFSCMFQYLRRRRVHEIYAIPAFGRFPEDVRLELANVLYPIDDDCAIIIKPGSIKVVADIGAHTGWIGKVTIMESVFISCIDIREQAHLQLVGEFCSFYLQCEVIRTHTRSRKLLD